MMPTEKTNPLMHPVNRTKDQKHATTSTAAENAAGRTLHPFLVKTLNKLGMEGDFLNVLKVICEKPTQMYFPG